MPDPRLLVCAADADTIDFDGFLRLLKVASSTDHLDQVGGAGPLPAARFEMPVHRHHFAP